MTETPSRDLAADGERLWAFLRGVTPLGHRHAERCWAIQRGYLEPDGASPGECILTAKGRRAITAGAG